MTNKEIIISLDLETGGLAPGTHTPLAIGAVALDRSDSVMYDHTNSFYGQLIWDDITVTPRAMGVNQLDLSVWHPNPDDDDLLERSYLGRNGISCFKKWVHSHMDKGSADTVTVHALGFNVGSFDLPMLHSIWDGDRIFHYRSIELNSVIFTLSELTCRGFGEVKAEVTEAAWKKNIFSDCMAHNALADAWLNVHVWKECLDRLSRCII